MLSVVVIATLPRRHLSSPLSPFITDHQGYDYQLPELGYTPNSSWGAWDLVSWVLDDTRARLTHRPRRGIQGIDCSEAFSTISYVVLFPPIHRRGCESA
jgi:hypothetical protein